MYEQIVVHKRMGRVKGGAELDETRVMAEAVARRSIL
jgi:hypothetical protein